MPPINGCRINGFRLLSSSKGETPKSAPIGPEDLMATAFDVLGIDPKLRFTNLAGRPVNLLKQGTPIRELV